MKNTLPSILGTLSGMRLANNGIHASNSIRVTIVYSYFLISRCMISNSHAHKCQRGYNYCESID